MLWPSQYFYHRISCIHHLLLCNNSTRRWSTVGLLRASRTTGSLACVHQGTDPCCLNHDTCKLCHLSPALQHYDYYLLLILIFDELCGRSQHHRWASQFRRSKSNCHVTFVRNSYSYSYSYIYIYHFFVWADLHHLCSLTSAARDHMVTWSHSL